MGKVFVCLSLVIPWFVLLSYICSLRLSSGHSGPVLTLRTNDAAHISLPSPHSLVVNEDVCVTSPSPRVVVVKHVFCILFVCLFFLSVMLPYKISKLPTDTPVRGFPTVWKLVLHDSLPRTGLHP